LSEKVLYIDGSSGISGDMIVGALLDLGADMDRLQNVLKDVPDQEHFRVRADRVKKSAIDCCSFSVIMDEAFDNHDHDMAYLYGREEHGHCAAGEHHAPGHRHRTLREVREILDGLSMRDGARKIAERVFEILGEAESKAHGVKPEEVHFHEVGAIDSIIDVVSAAVCLDDLGIGQVIITKLTEGTGTVRTQHGILPVPVPAVVNIAEANGLDLEIRDVRGEYVTPTGAAIAAAIRTSDRLPEKFRILKTGLGAGKREQELPGILRAMILEVRPENGDGNPERAEGNLESRDGKEKTSGRYTCSDRIMKLETNVDDCTGEELGFVMKRLFEAGARDVFYEPVYMKKNRPGWQLNVLCEPHDTEKMEDIIFSGTSTIGIRRVLMDRTCLPRRTGEVSTSYGKIGVKIVRKPEGEIAYPEYESAAAAAETNGVSLSEVYRETERAAVDVGRAD